MLACNLLIAIKKVILIKRFILGTVLDPCILAADSFYFDCHGVKASNYLHLDIYNHDQWPNY